MESEKYFKDIHFLGRVTSLIAISLMLAVPLITTLYFKVDLNWKGILSAVSQLAMIFVPLQLIEVISYTPVLGSGGAYLSFVTGNVLNMKLPAAKSAQNILEVEQGTDECEVVNVLAIGASSLMTTLILICMIFVFRPFLGALDNQHLIPAFNNVMPALLGAMLFPYISTNLRYIIAPLVLTCGFTLFIPKLSDGYTLACCIILSILVNKKIFQKQGETNE